MKRSDVYEIAIKILGLYLVVIVIEQLRDVLMYATVLFQSKNNPDVVSGFDQVPVFLVVVFSFLVLTAFAGLLIFKTKEIARIICKKDDFEETINLFTDKKAVYEITLVLVGLLTIILTIPEFALKLKNYYHSLQMNIQGNDNNTNFLIISGLKITVGILVVIYSKSISSRLTKEKNNP